MTPSDLRILTGSPVRPEQRFRRDNPCPVCAGCPEAPHGRGVRCWGYLSDDGDYAHCTRAERAGSLTPNDGSQTYAHRLAGECRCGTRHGADGNGVVRKRAWPLTHPSGIVVEHVREDRADGGKQVWWSRDGIAGLDGLRVEDLPLYGTDELRNVPKGSRIVVVEGEKSRDALKARGIVAVATVTGAKVTPSDESLRPLLEYVVLLWPDTDADGHTHMRRIAERLHGMGLANVRILDWPDAPPAGDAADFFACGGTRDELEALAAGAKIWADDMPAGAIHSAAPRDVVPAESFSLAFRTAEQIGEETPEEPRWLVHGLIAEGAITEIAGKIKSSGKTTFLFGVCAAILGDRHFAGRRTARTPIVYLSEQPDASLREALDRAQLLHCTDLHVLAWHQAARIPWPSVVAAVVEHCRRVGARLLIVDTLGQFAGISGDSENEAGAALAAMRPLQEAAAAGIGVALGRHARKSGGEVGDDGRGSSAFSGAADIVLSLRRAEGNGDPRVRVLHGLSRFTATPGSLAVRLGEDGIYLPLGDETTLALIEGRRRVLDALPADADQAHTLDELVKASGSRRSTAQEVVAALLAEETVVRLGAGKRGDPYRYHVPAETKKLSAKTTSLGAAERNRDNGHLPPDVDDPMLRAALDVFGDRILAVEHEPGRRPPDI